MTLEQVTKSTDAFRLLSDPTRFQILDLLFRTKKELCVGEIADAVGISHSAASHQLDKLETRGIVLCSRKGQMMCYEVNQNSLTRQLQRVMVFFNT